MFEIRTPNPGFPANESVVVAMERRYHDNTDCSEKAEDLMAAASGKGRIIRYQSVLGSFLQVPEQGGQRIEVYEYHDVYVDGRYLYDPSFSSVPMRRADYDLMIRRLNRGVLTLLPGGCGRSRRSGRAVRSCDTPVWRSDSKQMQRYRIGVVAAPQRSEVAPVN
jgi:hypothetical protein